MARIQGADAAVAALERSGVGFERFDHPALFTCEDSVRYGLRFPGADTKNLFLREEKGDRYFMVTVGHAKSVDLKSLAQILLVKRLCFGTEVQMQELLGVTPGSVTMLALLNDSAGRVLLYVDRAIWSHEQIQCHPLVNTSTLVIARAGLERFLTENGHPPQLIDVPERRVQPREPADI